MEYFIIKNYYLILRDNVYAISMEAATSLLGLKKRTKKTLNSLASSSRGHQRMLLCQTLSIAFVIACTSLYESQLRNEREKSSVLSQNMRSNVGITWTHSQGTWTHIQRWLFLETQDAWHIWDLSQLSSKIKNESTDRNCVRNFWHSFPVAAFGFGLAWSPVALVK